MKYLELPQKPQIIFVKQTDIVDPIPDHGNPFDPEPERPARPNLGIIPDVFEHLRVDHSAAGDLQPFLPHLASQRAAEIDLKTRLRVTEIMRSEANPGFRPHQFLEHKFDTIFGKYNVLLQSRNYVTKRQSLKLLGELLLNRSNFNIMMKYINDPNNLKIMMNLLRGNTKAIQFEAFHVFKIFVANPKKSKPVVEILVRNKKKLIEFLKKFQKDKEDEQFNDEKGILLATLEKLEGEPETGAAAAPAAEAKATA